MDMRTDRIQVPGLAGGISTQADHLRFADQVEDALNIDFDVALGARKRPGSRPLVTVRSPLPDAASVLDIHVIESNAEERYVVVYGRDASSDGLVFRVYNADDGTEASVTITPAAQAYLDLNRAGVGGLRLVTAADTTFIVNTTVATATAFTPNFAVGLTLPTEEALKRRQPSGDNTFHLGGTEFFRYDSDPDSVSRKGFAELEFREFNDAQDFATPTGNWDDPNGSGGSWEAPFNLGIAFKRQSLAVTGASWNNANRRLRSTGAFANYEWTPGDRIRISAGAFKTTLAGDAEDSDLFVEIDARIDDDNIRLGDAVYADDRLIAEATPTDATDASDYETNGIYHYYETQLQDGAYADLDAVASAWTQRFADTVRPRGSSFLNDQILMYFTSTGVNQGKMTVVGPFYGTEADDVFVLYWDGNGDQGLDATQSPFYFPPAYNSTPDPRTTGLSAGQGTTPTDPDEHLCPVEDRWSDSSEPSAPDAGLLPASMPIRMTRDTVSPLAFTVDAIAYNARTSGTNVTNPSPDLFTSSSRNGEITGITIAPQSVITSPAHGLATGETIDIIGSDSTPSVDGRRTVTVLSADTFRVDQAVSTAGQEGTWTIGGTRIRDAAFFQDRLWFVGGEYVAASQAGDIFNFYAADATNATDADPIDKRAGGGRVADFDALVPYRQTVLLMSLTGQQYELSSDGPFTPASVRIDPTTNIRAKRIEPAVMGSFVYFPSESGEETSLHEYLFDDSIVASRTSIVSAHFRGGIPSGVDIVSADASTQRVVLARRGSATFYVYRPFWAGGEKIQSAWSRWRLAGDQPVRGAAYLADRLYLLTSSAGEFAVQWIPAGPLGPENGYPAEVYADRQVRLTGTASGPDTAYDLSSSFVSAVAAGFTTLVKSTAFAGQAGQIVSNGTPSAWTTAGPTLTVTGQGALTAGEVILGAGYIASLTLTRPFLRDERDRAVIGSKTMHREAWISFRETGAATVEARSDRLPDRSVLYNDETPEAESSGVIRVPVRDNAADVDVVVTSTNVLAMNVDGAEHLIDTHFGLRDRV